MNNSDLFATFASQLFAVLHENFPVPAQLPRRQIIEDLENHDELWDLKRKASTVTDMAEMLEATGQMTTELREKAEQKKSELTAQIEDKAQRLRRMDAVFDGTVEFLVSEGFVRSDDNGTYQLSLKGFSHLHKRFEQGAIQDGATLIERLIVALRPERFSGSVASGTLVAIISKIFGG